MIVSIALTGSWQDPSSNASIDLANSYRPLRNRVVPPLSC